MFTPSAAGISALQFIWTHVQTEIHFAPVKAEDWSDEFFFCLLGGYSIPFELNMSAFKILKEKGYLTSHLNWTQVDKNAELIGNELSTRQFLPLLPNGKFRTYRFPNSKAHIIARAGDWLKSTCNFDIQTLLSVCTNSSEKRIVLMQCPGFGYKSSSWLLRNIGHGNRLAILDVHIYTTLQEFGIIPESWRLPRHYLEIEELYCYVCDLISAEPGVMDLVLWNWRRKWKN